MTIFSNSDSKQQESLGKGKDFVYSENTCNKKSGSESLTDENKLSDRSEQSINDASLDPLSEVKNLRLRNVNKVIIGNININSLPNKFEQLKELVMKHIDILVISEAKLDDSFPTSQFLMKGSADPFRLDRNRNRGGVMIYIRDDIPSRLLSKHVFPSDIESLYIELNFRKCKWLLLGTYDPLSPSYQYYFNPFPVGLFYVR